MSDTEHQAPSPKPEGKKPVAIYIAIALSVAGFAGYNVYNYFENARIEEERIALLEQQRIDDQKRAQELKREREKAELQRLKDEREKREIAEKERRIAQQKAHERRRKEKAERIAREQAAKERVRRERREKAEEEHRIKIAKIEAEEKAKQEALAKKLWAEHAAYIEKQRVYQSRPRIVRKGHIHGNNKTIFLRKWAKLTPDDLKANPTAYTEGAIDHRLPSSSKTFVARKGLSYLMLYASYSSDMEMFQAFVDIGENINRQDAEGKTALFYAIEFNSYEVVKFLIDNGADINLTPFENEGKTLLHYTAIYNRNPKTLELLIKKGLDIDALSDEKKAPIVYAAEINRNPAIVEGLMELGADTSYVSEKNEQLYYIFWKRSPKTPFDTKARFFEGYYSNNVAGGNQYYVDVYERLKP